MFEFDAGKLVIIGIVALIVIGPKDLPRVLRQAGQAMAKLRRMAAEFQSQFMAAMHEAELSDLEEEAAKLAASAKIGAGFNPISELRSELTRAIDGPAALAGGDGGGAVPPPAQVQAQNAIFAPELEGRDGLGVELPQIPGAARAETATEANTQGMPETGQLSHPGRGGAHGDAAPFDRAEPVNRT